MLGNETAHASNLRQQPYLHLTEMCFPKYARRVRKGQRFKAAHWYLTCESLQNMEVGSVRFSHLGCTKRVILAAFNLDQIDVSSENMQSRKARLTRGVEIFVILMRFM